MLVVPFGRRRLLGVVVDVAAESELPPERLAEPIAALEADVPQSLVALGLWVALEYVLDAGSRTGARAAAGNGDRRGPAAAAEALAAGVDHAGGRGGAARGRAHGREQRAALEALAAAPLGAAALASRTACTHSTLRSLERRGLIRLESAAEAPRRPRVHAVGALARSVSLTADQAGGLPRDRGRPSVAGVHPLLLHGVTGSGKTEVYLRSVAAALERGQSAIVLVPEIALTPQTAGRFVERFGDEVAVMHSRLSAARALRRVVADAPRRGARVRRAALGGVRAVRRPRPDHRRRGARQLVQAGGRPALRRARGRRAAGRRGGRAARGREAPRRGRRAWRATSGSACPRAWTGGELPPVELVAMAGTAGPLHERTREALDEVRRRGEKAIVLLNRRGWSNFLSCRSCARVWECPHCDVTLVLHRGARRGGVPPLRPPRAGAARVPGLRLGLGRAPRRRDRAAGAGARGAGGAAAGVPAGLRRGRGRGRRRGAAPLRRGAGRRARRHADGGEGPRLPRRHARRGAGRRRDAPLPRLPRRGAHVRAGGAARRAERPRRSAAGA